MLPRARTFIDRVVMKLAEKQKSVHSHGGVIYDRLFWRYFVRCQTCGEWRLRRRGEAFWKCMGVKILMPKSDHEIKIKINKLPSPQP
jgi:hypothetical protein